MFENYKEKNPKAAGWLLLNTKNHRKDQEVYFFIRESQHMLAAVLIYPNAFQSWTATLIGKLHRSLRMHLTKGLKWDLCGDWITQNATLISP